MKTIRLQERLRENLSRIYSFVLKTVTLDDKYRKALALHSGKATREKDISVKIVRKIMIY